jgi:hypothetical protein
MTHSMLSIRLGTSTRDYNLNSGLSSLNNGFYTLWLEENYNRYYRCDYFQLGGSRDLANGLNLKITFGLSNNIQLSNHSNFSIIDFDHKEIQPNIPANSTISSWQLENHQSLKSQLMLEYTPRYRYRVIDHRKVYSESKYPTFSLIYQRAYAEVFGADSRHDLLKLGIRQTVDFGISDKFSYAVNSGIFLNNNRIYFEDFEHFNTKPVEFMFTTFDNCFRLLPFYAYSTSRKFLDVHADYSARRLIVKYLPLIENISATENLMLNFLSTPELPVFVETGYGIHHSFLLFDLEVFAAFQEFQYQATGFRVSMKLK